MKNLFDIKDKVIVLTGGCGILGRNIANYLAEQGAKIVVLDRVEEAGRELEAELNQKSEALFLVTDVLNKEVLEENLRERHIRGGIATRHKYEQMKKAAR